MQKDANPKTRFYGRRTGRPMNAGRKKALEEGLPRFGIEIPNKGETISPAEIFGTEYKDYWLEVGFGNGESMLENALNHPNIGMIGAEPFLNGVSALLKNMADNQPQLNNIRILADDVRPLMDALPDASISRLYLLFPDPWPKTRHHFRRFINPDNLERLSRIIKKDGELRFASDHMELAEWMLSHTRNHPDFEWQVTAAKDWKTRPIDQPTTRYEKKSLQGEPAYFIFKRI